jgi:predicted patatin/cPLA2 family phospholipase
MKTNRKKALVIEGGAIRSIFSAGLLDGFLANDFKPFDFYIGVSAGAFNLLAYLSAQHGKSLELYKQVIASKDIIRFRRFINGGHLIDLDRITELVFDNIENDLADILSRANPLYICLTDVTSGNASYVRATQDNIKSTIKASASLPLFYRDFPRVNNCLMSDGGIADGIPVEEAIRKGATNIMVVRSRHNNYMKKDTIMHKYIRWKLRQYPALVESMRNRIAIYQRTLSVINNPPDNINIIEVCPPSEFTMGRFNTQYESLMKGYQQGLIQATSVIDQWNRLTE